MQLIIYNLDVSQYVQVSGFSESTEKVYDTANQFTTAEGMEIRPCRGVRKKYNVNLNNVPLNVKNMLRSRSRYGYVSCTVGSDIGSFSLDDFSAQVIIQNGDLNLWTVSFSLSAKTLIPGDEGETYNYTVLCEGARYSMESGEIIDDIKITNNIGGLPTSGICASQMSFSLDIMVYGGAIPGMSPSAECRIIGFDAPTYYITGRSLNGSTLTITATDRTIFLDLPFNYTSVFSWQDENGNVPTNIVLQNLYSQAGFSSFYYGDVASVVPTMPYADLNTSCRSILTTLAEAACGTWYCAKDNSLHFFGYGDWYHTFMLRPNSRTDVQKGLTTGPITGVRMINDSTDSGETEIYTSGNFTDILHSIKISSKYATASGCGAVYSRVKDTTYSAFSIAHCQCWEFVHIGAKVEVYDSSLEYYLATNINISLSSTGPYASISGDAISDLEWDFSGELTQKVNQRIAENQKYHGVYISKTEGLVCDGLASKAVFADGRLTFFSKKDNGAKAAALKNDRTEIASIGLIGEKSDSDTSDDN